MDEKDKNVRRERTDTADAEDGRETHLPGQIPVEEADAGEMQNPEERQPDPVQAEQAVNPELQGAGRGREKRKPVAEDRPKR